jgi:uncharacterized membrane protein YbhN (UPF0104 family)
VWRTVVLLALVAVAAFTLSRQWSEVEPDLRRINIATLIGATLLGAVPSLAGAQAWRVLLGGLHHPLPVRETTSAFCVAQLGKYLPGSLWPIVIQGELATAHGISRRRAASASVLQIALLLEAGAVISLICLIASGGLPAWGLLALAVACVGFLVCLLPPVLRRLSALVLRRLRRGAPEASLGWPEMIEAFGWSLLATGGLGLHAWLLGRALGDVSLGRAAGGFLLAWAAGLLVPIVPAGGGVRETILYASLNAPLGHSAAIALAAVSRLLLVIVDVVVGAVAALTRRRSHPRTPSAGTQSPLHAPGASAP